MIYDEAIGLWMFTPLESEEMGMPKGMFGFGMDVIFPPSGYPTPVIEIFSPDDFLRLVDQITKKQIDWRSSTGNISVKGRKSLIVKYLSGTAITWQIPIGDDDFRMMIQRANLAVMKSQVTKHQESTKPLREGASAEEIECSSE